MPDIEKYDVVVLGSGEAGKYISWHLGTSGKRTAVIERKYIGGSCPNIACLPSKNVVHSAKVASYMQRAKEFGVTLGPWSIDMAGVRQRKRIMVDGNLEVHLANYKKSGTDIVMGQGRFIAEKTLEVALSDGTTPHPARGLGLPEYRNPRHHRTHSRTGRVRSTSPTSKPSN